MNMLYWSDELAATAQRHADTCDFRHSRGRVNVGENIWAAPYSNYSDAISIWFNEVRNWPSGNIRLDYRVLSGISRFYPEFLIGRTFNFREIVEITFLTVFSIPRNPKSCSKFPKWNFRRV